MHCKNCGEAIPNGQLCRKCESRWAVGWVRAHLAQRLRLESSHRRGDTRYIRQLKAVAAEVRQACPGGRSPRVRGG